MRIFQNIKFKRIAISAVSAILFVISVAASAETFNAFPGKYKATIVRVEAANIIHLAAAVWTGYPRQLRVTLANIDIPQVDSKTPACQIELANKALVLTNEFVTTAKEFYVKDIYMENTGSVDGITDVLSELGSLSSALISKGYARSSHVAKNAAWC